MPSSLSLRWQLIFDSFEELFYMITTIPAIGGGGVDVARVRACRPALVMETYSTSKRDGVASGQGSDISHEQVLCSKETAAQEASTPLKI